MVIKETCFHLCLVFERHKLITLLPNKMTVLVTLTILLAFSTITVLGDRLPSVDEAACVSLSHPGDVTIGGIFPVHFSGNGCEGVPSMWTLQLIEAMKYAIQDINQRDDILPNVKLGWDIRDDCFVNHLSLWAAATLVSDGFQNVTGRESCQSLEDHTANVVGIVGPLTSAYSITVETFTSVFRVPIISYGATSDELSDENRFPYFLRSVPPDRLQAEAIVDLIDHYGWEYVAVIYEANTYGIRGVHAVQLYAEQRGICIPLTRAIQRVPSEQEVLQTVQLLQSTPKVNTIVFIAGGIAGNAVVTACHQAGYTAKFNWIGSEAFGHDLARHVGEHPPVGGLFINFFAPNIDTFIAHFRSISDEDIVENPWFNKHWLSYSDANDCLGDPSDCKYLDSISFAKTGPISPVMDAVYAIAHGLHSLLDECDNGTESGCDVNNEIDGEQLLHNIKSASFVGTRGLFQFNDVGDLEGKYTWTNLQLVNGKYQLVKVGIWDALNTTNRLTLSDHIVRWGTDEAAGFRQSSCRDSCQPGYIVTPLEQKCCWGCRRCPVNAIVVNGTECLECGITEWPDDLYTYCNEIKPDFVTLTNPLILLVILLCFLDVVLSVGVTIGIVVYAEHPVVKATSRELSSVNIIGLFLSGAAVAISLITPTMVSCCLSEVLVSFCFTLTYAPTLLKVNRIHRIFQSSKTSTQRPKYTSPKAQVALVTIFICGQVGFEPLCYIL